MLLLRRKVHDSVLIGDDIEIRVVRVGDAEVTLGIEAPTSVLVDRKEVRAKRSVAHETDADVSGGKRHA